MIRGAAKIGKSRPISVYTRLLTCTAVRAEAVSVARAAAANVSVCTTRPCGSGMNQRRATKAAVAAARCRRTSGLATTARWRNRSAFRPTALRPCSSHWRFCSAHWRLCCSRSRYSSPTRRSKRSSVWARPASSCRVGSRMTVRDSGSARKGSGNARRMVSVHDAVFIVRGGDRQRPEDSEPEGPGAGSPVALGCDPKPSVPFKADRTSDAPGGRRVGPAQHR